MFPGTGSNMPKAKQPMSLQDLLVKTVVSRTADVYWTWIRKLRKAAVIGREAYLEETQNVMTDCDKLHDHLASFPIGIKKHVLPLILKGVIDVITDYDHFSYELKRASWYREEEHNTVCSKILRAVLLTCTSEYETKVFVSSFVQKLIFQTLDSVPNLTTLAVNTETEINNSAVLARNIHHLTQLQHFHCEYDCTDEVVEQLALHCTQLKTINVKYSPEVTDASVHHLMNLRKLEYMDLEDTSISFQSYGVLLSELPSISNIIMIPRTNDVIDHISKEKLYKVTHFTGYIHNYINILTQKCPNITKAVLYTVKNDLTNLTALSRLVNLKIIEGNCIKNNLNAVLIGMGHRLSELCLREVHYINMVDVVHSCSSLKSLVLKRCSFIPLTESAILDTDLPQYKSLIELKLIYNYGSQDDFRYLRHYVNLEVFECGRLDIVTDDFLEDAIRQGAFRNIVRFWVEDTSTTLTMRTVELLLQHCDSLREIGNLRRWRLLSSSEYTDLIKRKIIMNIDLLVH
jgi:hypothetical protein